MSISATRGWSNLSPVREYEDQEFIIERLEKHVKYTGSTVARDILHGWHEFLPKFVKVLPLEYKRAMDEHEAVHDRRKARPDTGRRTTGSDILTWEIRKVL